MTAEYSKSVDTFVKKILTSENCLHMFFELVGVASRSVNQAAENLQYVHMKTCMPIEEHAQSILTPYAFKVLQNEMVLSLQYATTEMANGSYHVQHYKKLDRECLVIWTPEDELMRCSCKEFEHSGLLCRHSIRVLVAKNYFQLPEKYFPLRWRLESSLVPVDDDNVPRSSNDCVQAFNSLAAALLTESFTSKERFNYVNRELGSLIDRVRDMPAVDDSTANMAPNRVNESFQC